MYTKAAVLLGSLVCISCGVKQPDILFVATPDLTISGEDPGLLFTPSGLQVDDSGRILILDCMMKRIMVFDPDGRFVSAFGESGEGPGQLIAPFWNFCVGPSGNSYLIDGNVIEEFDSEGRFVRSIGLSQMGTRIFDVAATDSLIFINYPSPFYESGQGVIIEIGQDGRFIRRFGEVPGDLAGMPPYLSTFHQACPLDVDADGNVYYTSIMDYALYKYSPDGTLIWRTDPATSLDPVLDVNTLVSPSVWDLCVDGGMVFVMWGQSGSPEGSRVDVFSCETGEFMGILHTGVPLECRPPFIFVGNGSELYTADPDIAAVYRLSLSRI